MTAEEMTWTCMARKTSAASLPVMPSSESSAANALLDRQEQLRCPVAFMGDGEKMLLLDEHSALRPRQ